MTRRKYLTGMLVTLIGISVCILFVNDSMWVQDYHISVGSSDGHNSEQEVTCQFPTFDPFHKDAMKYYQKYPPPKCNGLTTLSYYDGKFVRVNQTLKQLKHRGRTIQCWYRDVAFRSKMNFVNGDWHGPFTESIEVQSKPEYVQVECKTKEGKTVSRMHHYATREEYRKSSKPTKNDEILKDNQLNIILIGVDSLANYLFKRAMPKTRKYLLNNLKAVELNRYNKVGDNTFPNMLAILAGIYENEPKDWTLAQGFDALPFIWNDFKKSGYRTQYTSDRFDFDDFMRPPTDSYNLPMLAGLATTVNVPDFDIECYEDKNEVKLWLNHVSEFAKESMFESKRFFSVAMIKRPTHDYPNKASAVDDRYEEFLIELKSSNVLNNTFLVFFGDHGPRATSYRRTFLGSIEERAANMVIYVPPWFKKRYPTHYANLLANQERLTTNFDIHATLKGLLSLNDNSYKMNNVPKAIPSVMSRGMSLFTDISPRRTCEDAQIDAHNCLCHGGVSVDDRDVMTEVGTHVANYINSLLLPVSSLCAPLKLKEVESMVLLSGSVGWSATYRVIMSTVPGDAVFEATVEYSVTLLFFKSIRTLSYISRVNMYRGQSDCVNDDKQLRMYCYCRNLLTDQS